MSSPTTRGDDGDDPGEPFELSVPSLPRVRARIEERWAALLLVVAVATQAFATWRIVRKLDPGTRPALRDSIIFEYIGWRLAEGARLYVDLWEVKPPLAYEIPAALALLAGDVFVYHWLAVLVTNAAAAGAVLLVGGLVHEITDDGLAAIAGGLALFTHPAFGWRAPIGFKAKYFVVAFGLLGIYLVLRRRPLLAGLAAGAAAGVWQFGIVFPALGVGLLARRSDRGGLARFVAGGIAAWAVVLAPVVYWGALDAMIVETVFTPLLVASQRPMPKRIRYAVRLLDLALPIALLGLYGAVAALRERWRAEGWWIPAGAAWFALAILLFDFDGPPDLIPSLAFIALGVGIVVAEDRSPAIVWLVAAMAAVSVLTLGEFGYFGRLTVPAVQEIPDSMSLSVPYSSAERRFLFWRTQAPGTCRPFFGLTQYKLIDTLHGRVTMSKIGRATCGAWEPAWGAMQAKYPILRPLPG